jgi:hypothetical protein
LEQEQKEIGGGAEEEGSEETSEKGSELAGDKEDEEEPPKVTVSQLSLYAVLCSSSTHVISINQAGYFGASCIFVIGTHMTLLCWSL